MKYDQRLDTILNRLEISFDDVIPLAGDASARCFYRVTFPRNGVGSEAVLIEFPKSADEEEVARYAGMAVQLREAGLPVPEIYQDCPGIGYILAEDCGNIMLQDILKHRAPEPLYRQAVDLIIDMQERILPATARWNPPFDEDKFLRELDFFLTHTLKGYCGAGINRVDESEFRQAFHVICREALSQPKVFCHRDYHSRNLLIQGDNLRIVDFQDGRPGPYTYDLVSLLEDPYVALPSGLKEEMKRYYFTRKPVWLDEIILDDFQRGYDMMALQRLFKAAGTYGYMFREKGKREYITYLPTVFERVSVILERYPGLAGLKELLEKYAGF